MDPAAARAEGEAATQNEGRESALRKLSYELMNMTGGAYYSRALPISQVDKRQGISWWVND